MRLRRVLFAVVLGAAMAIPAQARADFIFTPFIGANLHQGDDTFGFDTQNGTVNFGGTLRYMGAGVIGFEMDFGSAPNFFDQEEVSTLDGNVTTFMGNLIFGIPIGGQTGGGVRPYLTGGAGLLRSRLDDVDDFFDINENSFGIDAGRRRLHLLQRHRGHSWRPSLLPQLSRRGRRQPRPHARQHRLLARERRRLVQVLTCGLGLKAKG